MYLADWFESNEYEINLLSWLSSIIKLFLYSERPSMLHVSRLAN